MNYIIDEIKQRDTEFIRIPSDKKLIQSRKLYLKYANFDIKYDCISVMSGNLIQYKSPDQDNTETYEMVEYDTKSIFDIFYNFCINYLSNGYTHTQDYIMLFILGDNLNINNYSIRYRTLEQYEEFTTSRYINTLTINNIDDLEKYYDIINQMQSASIFLKLKKLKN
jgi:hypothetical protein